MSELEKWLSERGIYKKGGYKKGGKSEKISSKSLQKVCKKKQLIEYSIANLLLKK